MQERDVVYGYLDDKPVILVRSGGEYSPDFCIEMSGDEAAEKVRTAFAKAAHAAAR